MFSFRYRDIEPMPETPIPALRDGFNLICRSIPYQVDKIFISVYLLPGLVSPPPPAKLAELPLLAHLVSCIDSHIRVHL